MKPSHPVVTGDSKKVNIRSSRGISFFQSSVFRFRGTTPFASACNAWDQIQTRFPALHLIIR